MQILNNKQEVIDIIKNKSKYQKVMLIYDDNVSNVEITDTYNSIREFCIYNQSKIQDLDANELYNGYKAVIYLCSTNSFINLNFNRNDFVNIFLPTDAGILPFCLSNENKISTSENYIYSKPDSIDIFMQSSIYFNEFYNYFKSLLGFENRTTYYNLEDNIISQHFALERLKDIDKNLEFIDIDILKKTNLQYENLGILHILLIDAIILLLSNVKNKTLEFVDFYKACKDNYSMLDKFYAMANNDAFFTLINLNYNSLINLSYKVKEKILECASCSNININSVDSIINNLKTYTKSTDNVLSYLYLFDFFNV